MHERERLKTSLVTILQGKQYFETMPNRVENPEDTREPCPWLSAFTVCHGEVPETIHTKTT